MDYEFSWTYSEGPHPNKHGLQGLLQQEETRYTFCLPHSTVLQSHSLYSPQCSDKLSFPHN